MLLAAACGGDRGPEPEDEVRSVVRKAYVELYRGNARTFCDLHTPAGRKRLIRETDLGPGTSCEHAARALGAIASDLRATAPDKFDNPHVQVVAVTGVTARATVSVDVRGVEPERFELRRVGGEWRIESVA